jgi:hypothetical protein
MSENGAKLPRRAPPGLAAIVGLLLLAASTVPGSTWRVAAYGRGASLHQSASDSSSGAARVPVVVELFTSEGCSSCPPADKFLANLDLRQPVPGALIIPLEEHVDYWDRDGWRDRFSSPVFTDRQVEYAQRFGLSGPASPQLVVAGRAPFYLNSMPKSREAILEAMRSPQARVSLTLAGGAEQNELLASIKVEDYPAKLPKKDDKAEVRLAVTEDGLDSDVRAGENSGKHLEHRAVVRKLVSAGEVKPDRPFSSEVKVPLDKQWNREHLRVVVFLEAHGSHQIIGAATAPVSP